MPQLIWLVTGCATGIGEQFVHGILERGDRVIATARDGSARLKHLEAAGAAIFNLDVTATQRELNSNVEEIRKIYGRIDVLVNNAGFLQAGLVEDISHEEYVKVFNTNTFGVINTTRAVLPHFRAQRSGVVAFIGSVSGWVGDMGSSPYGSTKFAIEGIQESLRQETSHLGIRSIIFELGAFRTDFMHPDRMQLRNCTIEDYTSVSNQIAQNIAAANGNQPGDPRKAVETIVDVIKADGAAKGREMPERLPLGADALTRIREKCMATLKICDEWENVITSTNFVETVASKDENTDKNDL